MFPSWREGNLPTHDIRKLKLMLLLAYLISCGYWATQARWISRWYSACCVRSVWQRSLSANFKWHLNVNHTSHSFLRKSGNYTRGC